MKKLFTILVLVCFTGHAWAQTTEYLLEKDFKTEKKKIYEGINASKKQLAEVQKGNIKVIQHIDSLRTLLVAYTKEVGMINDSIAALSAKLNALQQKVESEQFLPKSLRVLMNLLLYLSVIILFVLIFLFRKKAAMNFQTLAEMDKKTNERIDLGMKNLHDEVQKCRDHINAVSGEMNQKISAGLNTIEMRNNQLSLHLQENMARIDDGMGKFGAEIGRLREEQSNGVRTIQDKMTALKQETEKHNQLLANQAGKLEEELKSIKGRIKD